MASIKPLKCSTVHQIQSGQVIIDLCSVVKELVENSLDAGATVIDVRFKNYGLDAIEVQDNGSGIAPENYETLALKHYTSKLSSYEDLNNLHTFGFRGEALSSLCALSELHVLTAQADDGSKGQRLDFEISGALRKASVAACQKGTTVSANNIFHGLPVRRRELEKNIKREYGKVVGVLNAYACISTDTKFTASNVLPKGKKSQIFSTKSNGTTKENISNVFGVKSVAGLVLLDLKFELQPSPRSNSENDCQTREARVVGYVSKPVTGEGRQAPDRQMFFVNSRPCNLPQISKAFNEVYKSYNLSQSPFIFANLLLDTAGYDVNVSPDKRFIMLYDQTSLLENLKSALVDLFEEQEQTVPQAQVSTQRLPPFRQLTIQHCSFGSGHSAEQDSETATDHQTPENEDLEMTTGVEQLARPPTVSTEPLSSSPPRREDENSRLSRPVLDFNTRIASQEMRRSRGAADSSRQPNVVQSAYDRIRPQRSSPETAVITVGSKIIVSPLKSLASRRSPRPTKSKQAKRFSDAIRSFRAAGSQINDEEQMTEEEEDGEGADGQGLRLSREAEEGDSEDGEEAEEVEGQQGTIENDGSDAMMEKYDAHHSDEVEQSVNLEATSSTSPLASDPSNGSDNEYFESNTEIDKKAQDESRVKQLIQEAEASSNLKSADTTRRTIMLMKGGAPSTESTINFTKRLRSTIPRIFQLALHGYLPSYQVKEIEATYQSPEEKLSLTVSKTDFGLMQIIGQFNLGFILASRRLSDASTDIFIIDQHASDEKYNFERLQASTIVQNQRLVRPQALSLTAMEEEIVQDRRVALEKNGFVVAIDVTGSKPVGQRCEIVSLPMSKDVVFDIKDLEELLALLSETPETEIPRPDKVRRMFAMRACRSSVMVGSTLNKSKMGKLVYNMGQIEKPWNCPHGRPTMRHLCGLQDWNSWKTDKVLFDWGSY
ncbi:MAG: hypothetical protein M1814_002721 [Vezdaea aestivalis]|nr:MAG: hypothetical protein M1814_002721 [Vezdaea aestivalis]